MSQTFSSKPSLSSQSSQGEEPTCELSSTHVDVVIVGSGIAGLSALRTVVKQGLRCALVCEGPVFSGGSFFPGTWGLGLIGPECEQDENSFIESILSVGQGVADPKLVEHFVRSINACVSELEDEGLQLIHPENPQQKEYIPCFDTKLRRWRGLTHKALRDFFGRFICSDLVQCYDHHELLEISPTNDTLVSVELFSKKDKCLRRLSCTSLVLAAGGSGGLFSRRLSSQDILSSVQGLALGCGLELTNIEFMQMMPGLVRPRKNLVFNEKVFRWLDFPFDQEVLERRSGHGPFTVEWQDFCVDELIQASTDGYDCATHANEQELPEFVQVYDQWLEKQAGIRLSNGVALSLYAHAANGGIKINADAQTSVPGIFACGEITGGMHGADRIGGLSSANCIVFGRQAGLSAAAFVRKHKREKLTVGRSASDETHNTAICSPAHTMTLSHDSTPTLHALDKMQLENLLLIQQRLQELCSQKLMIQRSAEGLEALIAFCEQELEFLTNMDLAHQHPRLIAAIKRLNAQLLYAQAIATAALLRKESRGAHQRAEYAHHAPEYSKAQTIRLVNGHLCSNFTEI